MDVTKLPKWAQQKIDDLQRHLAKAYDELAVYKSMLNNGVATGASENARVIVEFTTRNSIHAFSLPLGSDVTFKIGPTSADRFTVCYSGDRLMVNGGHSILVHPFSSNVVHVAMKSQPERA
jgi:hypothetical protein